LPELASGTAIGVCRKSTSILKGDVPVASFGQDRPVCILESFVPAGGDVGQSRIDWAGSERVIEYDRTSTETTKRQTNKHMKAKWQKKSLSKIIVPEQVMNLKKELMAISFSTVKIRLIVPSRVFPGVQSRSTRM
jgi:hypothetical protein